MSLYREYPRAMGFLTVGCLASIVVALIVPVTLVLQPIVLLLLLVATYFIAIVEEDEKEPKP